MDTDAGPITAESARRLACNATISTVAVDGRSGPIVAGHARRVVPPASRRALEARQQHCTHPGCDIPARWCDAHHVVHWADGGPTTLANLQLLCRRHHRAAHYHQAYPRRQ